MKKINITQLAALLTAVILTTIINPTVSVIFMSVMAALATGVLAFGVDPDDIWPSFNKPKIKQNPDGSFTVSLHDAAAKGQLFVSNENVLYTQKAVDSIKENTLQEGAIVGAAVASTVLVASYAIYRIMKKSKK